MSTASTHAPSLRRVALVVLSAAALAVAACGTKASFIDGYNQATQPLARLNTDIAAATASGDKASVERLLPRLATQFGAVGQRLRALQPPEQAQDELDRLVAALDTTAGDANATVAAMRSGHQRRVARMIARFTASAGEMVAADQALKTAVEG